MDELVIQALVWKDAQDIITKAGYVCIGMIH